jgi:uncharacterized protein (DUF1015 family)
MLARGWQPVPVPRFEPFAATRYGADVSLDAVCAPPYDVLSDADVDELARRDTRNIVHVDVPRPADAPDRYARAAAQLRSWRAAGTMVNDAVPTLTLYRMRFTDEAGTPRHTVGVIGALEVVDEGADGVLAHERTTPKASTDRLDLTRATNANLSPVWGLSLAAGLTGLLAEPGEPMGSCTDDAGVVHSVERVTDPLRIERIAGAVGAQPVLIADGHHRYGVARTYRDEVRARAGTGGAAELTMAYVAELVGEQLSIDAIHRVYAGLGAEQLLERLSASFEPAPAGPVRPDFAAQTVRRGALCLVHPDGTGTWLTPRPRVFAGVRQLDGALLEHALDGCAVDVTYQHGVAETVALVTGGRADAAVLIRPTSIAEIRRTVDERVLMPPKSTFFTPKLRTGLVIRTLE